MSIRGRYGLLGNAGGATPPVVPTFDFFILAGQSNCGNTPASGMTTGQKALYDIVVPNTNIFNPTSPSGSSGAFQPLNIGVNSGIANQFNADAFGPEAAWFVDLNNNLPKTRYFFKYGVGNTSLAVDWNSRTPGGAGLYAQMLGFLDSMLSLMVAANTLPKLKAFVWMQGEADANDATQASNYQTNLQNLFTDVKAYWASRTTSFKLPASGNNFLTIIPQINAPGETSRLAVRAAETAYCAIGANNATLLNTDGYSNGGGGLHYDQTGQIQFGGDLYNLVKAL